MILGADGAKLSKRHGAVSVLQYRDEGYLPEALLNYLVRLGWSHGDQEVFSIEEMQQLFDIGDVNKSASAFNPEKLLWLNQQHIMRATPERLAKYLKPQLAALGVAVTDERKLMAVAKALQERAKTLQAKWRRTACSSFATSPATTRRPRRRISPRRALRRCAQFATSFRRSMSGLPPAIHEAVNQTATELGVGLGKVAQPVRVAVVGYVGIAADRRDARGARTGEDARTLARLQTLSAECSSTSRTRTADRRYVDGARRTELCPARFI